MTINGPAPTVLAFFLNTAIDQAKERGIDAAETLRQVRGTVQADILKEDQGQNTCLFSTEFSLRMMADIQEWFIEHQVRNFYSVSISGYHIAEAGANPISQLAFTLANGFTYVEAYLARGMDIDDFAPNLSFFFSNGMDPEYSVLGRVARRIWAVTMRDRYGANERSQKLKYHVQTSGRSLHAQEMSFNDIRTTLQALIAIYDNANSLHTNAFDEAVTTPSNASVRRALAIQMIINREWGVAMNENPTQGAFLTDELTDLVEAAVLAEFDSISERGGVLGAMETGYQRGRIQDESMLYEQRKHDGSLPIVGVNTFLNPNADDEPPTVELARATEKEKKAQLDRVQAFQKEHRTEATRGHRPAQGSGHVRRERLRRADGRRAGLLAAAGDRGVLRGGRPVPSFSVSELPTYDQIVQLPVRVEEVVPPEFIDENGHMNIRHYFDAASHAMWYTCIALGMDESYNTDRSLSLFTVEQHLRYFSEMNLGDRFTVHGRLLERSGKALHGMAFVVSTESRSLACTFEVMYIHVDMTTRRSVEMPDDIAASFDAEIARGDELGWAAPVCGAMGVHR